MNWIFSLLLTLHLITAAAIIALVLMQHGKGADMGAAFGSGASGSLFGASGSANFLSRSTAVLAAVFFCTSLSLTYVASKKALKPSSLMQQVDTNAPAVPPTAPILPSGSVEKTPAPAAINAAEEKTKAIPQ